MTETTSKIEKWAYPLKVGTAEATDPQQFYAALAKAKDGFYPLGANGLWHGGIHFDDDSGLVGDLTEVRCIADGEVVAYRIDEAYPKSDFGSTQAVYSTGFVLVKHRLEAPAMPPPAPAPGAQPAAAVPGPSLTFFSLYMHLLDWQGYKSNPTLARPGFWDKSLYQVKANLPTKSLGLRVRNAESGQSSVLAVLPRGTTVLTKPADATKKWLEIVSVTPELAGLAPNTGWVFKGEMLHLGGDRYFVGKDAKDVPPDQKSGANVRSATTNGSLIALLPAGTQIRISDEQAAKKYRKLVEVVSGQPIPALTAGADGKLPGFVWLDDLEAKRQPHSPMGQVVPLTTTFKIKAGEVLGHVGKYQNHSDPAPRNLLHLEVFSCEDVKAFTELSKSSARGLPASERTLLKIPKDSLLITHVTGMNATNPPKVSDAHKVVGHDFFIPVGVLESLPAEKRIKVPVVMGGMTTYTHWWRLDGMLGDAEGNGIDGWFAEPDITLSRHSPFEWEGFTFIDDTASNVDQLAAFLQLQESLTEEECANYLPEIENANNGAAKQQLYKILDKNKDNKLTRIELKSVLKKPWLSQSISQMVTRYESEWKHEIDKWNSLDELMGHSEACHNKEWLEEKTRIERLSWWAKLAGQYGITSEFCVQHLHFLSLVGSFCARREHITMEMLKAANPAGNEVNYQNILPYLNKYAFAYGLEQPRAIAHFLSQVAHESGLKIVEESLKYTATQMKRVYGCRTQNNVNGYNAANDSCNFGVLRSKLWTEESTYAMNEENLGSYVYANRMGNGDEDSKEGYKYRGRGMLQVTGKSEYRRFTTVHNQKNPTDIQDFVSNPDLLVSSTEYGVESAFVFWFTKTGQGGVKLWEVAKTGSVAEVTQLVNGGQNGYADRNNRFQSIATLMGI